MSQKSTNQTKRSNSEGSSNSSAFGIPFPIRTGGTATETETVRRNSMSSAKASSSNPLSHGSGKNPLSQGSGGEKSQKAKDAKTSPPENLQNPNLGTDAHGNKPANQQSSNSSANDGRVERNDENPENLQGPEVGDDLRESNSQNPQSPAEYADGNSDKPPSANIVGKTPAQNLHALYGSSDDEDEPNTNPMMGKQVGIWTKTAQQMDLERSKKKNKSSAVMPPEEGEILENENTSDPDDLAIFTSQNPEKLALSGQRWAGQQNSAFAAKIREAQYRSPVNMANCQTCKFLARIG